MYLKPRLDSENMIATQQNKDLIRINYAIGMKIVWVTQIREILLFYYDRSLS